MLALAADGHPPVAALGRTGARSHRLLLAILGAAQGEKPSRSVMAELFHAVRKDGPYAASEEELTPTRGDLRAEILSALAATSTFIWPGAWRWFVGRSIESYALTPGGWDQILANVRGD